MSHISAFPPLSLSSSLYLYLIRLEELEKKNINKIEAERYRILARILMIRMRMARADGCHVCSSSSALLEMEVHLEKSVTSREWEKSIVSALAENENRMKRKKSDENTAASKIGCFHRICVSFVILIRLFFLRRYFRDAHKNCELLWKRLEYEHKEAQTTHRSSPATYISPMCQMYHKKVPRYSFGKIFHVHCFFRYLQTLFGEQSIMATSNIEIFLLCVAYSVCLSVQHERKNSNKNVKEEMAEENASDILLNKTKRRTLRRCRYAVMQ